MEGWDRREALFFRCFHRGEKCCKTETVRLVLNNKLLLAKNEKSDRKIEYTVISVPLVST
jgi:hypothetical protein